MRRSFSIALVLASFLSFFLIACGGDSNDADNGSGAPGEGSSSSGAPIEALSLGELQSFRFEASIKFDAEIPELADDEDPLGAAFAEAIFGFLSDVRVEGAFVAPGDFELTLHAGDEEIGFVKVGDRSWVAFGGNWIEATDSLTGSVPATNGDKGLASPGLDEDLAALLAAATTSREEVGGVETTRYSLDRDALAAASADEADLMGLEDVAFDIWITDAGLPVKLEFLASGADDQGQAMSIELSATLSDINSDSIGIEPPVSD